MYTYAKGNEGTLRVRVGVGRRYGRECEGEGEKRVRVKGPLPQKVC